jgi:hypothetical protein
MKAVKNADLVRLKEILDNPEYPGVDVNYEDPSSEYADSPLIVAADLGNLDTIELLLQYKTGSREELGQTNATGAKQLCTLELRDSLGSTALFCAKDADVARLLIRAGADVHARNLQDSTALHIHAWHGRYDVVDVLCRHIVEHDGGQFGPSAAINARNKYFRTPLHRAAEIQEAYLYEGKAKACRVLIKHGADLHMEDEELNNPDSLARDTGYDELADNMALWASRRKVKTRESCTDNCVVA